MLSSDNCRFMRVYLPFFAVQHMIKMALLCFRIAIWHFHRHSIIVCRGAYFAMCTLNHSDDCIAVVVSVNAFCCGRLTLNTFEVLLCA